MRTRKKSKCVHEGRYVAEVEVDLIDEEGGWSPYLSDERRAARKKKVRGGVSLTQTRGAGNPTAGGSRPYGT